MSLRDVSFAYNIGIWTVLMNRTKSGFVLAGIAFGMARAVAALFPGVAVNRRLDLIEDRLDLVGLAVMKLEARSLTVESAANEFVDRKQLEAAIEQAFLPLAREVDRRFVQQSESVNALRVMVSRTDELLGRVLEHLESMEHRNAA